MMPTGTLICRLASLWLLLGVPGLHAEDVKHQNMIFYNPNNVVMILWFGTPEASPDAPDMLEHATLFRMAVKLRLERQLSR